MTPYKVINWGAGLHSTTLAAMSALGDLPPVDLVVFADTRNERKKTYEIVKFYSQWLTDHNIATTTISNGSVLVHGAEEHIHIPFWTSSGAPLNRQCTREFKIRPIKRFIRRLIGYHPSLPPHPPANKIEQWIGFAYDELERMKPSSVKYISNKFPLIDLRMTTNDCIDYLQLRGLPIPPNSACIICPFRKASEWLTIRRESPDEFELACQFDEANRHNPLADNGSSASELYIYKHQIPLRQANLITDAKREKPGKQLKLFCMGTCRT